MATRRNWNKAKNEGRRKVALQAFIFAQRRLHAGGERPPQLPGFAAEKIRQPTRKERVLAEASRRSKRPVTLAPVTFTKEK